MPWEAGHIKSREKPWRGIRGGPGPESWLLCGDWDGWEQGEAGRRGSSVQGERGRLQPGRRCGWWCGEVARVWIGVGRVTDGAQRQARHETGRERPGRVQVLAPAIVAINGPGNGCWGAGWGAQERLHWVRGAIDLPSGDAEEPIGSMSLGAGGQVIPREMG